jgi:hypothetical protein
MKNQILLTKSIDPLRNSMNRSPLRRGYLFIPLALVSLALSQATRAVSPPPDGGYANFNTAEGTDSLFSLTSGSSNTAIGYHALFANTTGGDNTANGSSTLVSNTTGSDNTAIGRRALQGNTSGIENTATGVQALAGNTTANLCTADGFQALFDNTTGFGNTATGAFALNLNTTGGSNTATGEAALSSNTIGFANTANGVQALFENTTGTDNTADGTNALLNNTTGTNNTAEGSGALVNNSSGNNNTGCGVNALANNLNGSGNIALGYIAGGSLTTGSNNIDIGNGGVAAESNTIRLGTAGTQTATFIAGITGTPITGSPVTVSATGQLGIRPSSARFKEKIKPMQEVSEAILALKPVTFHYKKDLDADGTLQFGLVAEDVEKVNRDLVVHDDQDKPYSVRYEAVNAMLLNEFLKAHRTVQDLKAVVAQQQKQIEALTAGLEKVSAQVKLSKSAPQMAGNQ